MSGTRAYTLFVMGATIGVVGMINKWGIFQTAFAASFAGAILAITEWV